MELLSRPALSLVMPMLGPPSRSQAMIEPLNAALVEWSINTPLRIAAFLAQVAHESGELRFWEEGPHNHPVPGCHMCHTRVPHPAGAQYEGRADLGNTMAGDGIRYLGRGPIQLTGRYNYRRAGGALGLDLLGNPEQVATPAVGFRVAGWFWKTSGLNELADVRDFVGITKRVNGGENGLEQRTRYYDRALRVLDVSPAPAAPNMRGG
jgi:putative chitinase